MSGANAYVSTLQAGMMFFIPVLFGGVLATFAASAGRNHALIAGVVLAVLAQGAVHLWSLMLGGLAAWLCLAVGVVIWSAVLPRPAIRPAAPGRRPLSRRRRKHRCPRGRLSPTSGAGRRPDRHGEKCASDLSRS